VLQCKKALHIAVAQKMWPPIPHNASWTLKRSRQGTFFLCSFTRIFTDDGTFSLEEVETVKQKMFVFESWVKKAWLFYISQQHEVIYNIAVVQKMLYIAVAQKTC